MAPSTPVLYSARTWFRWWILLVLMLCGVMVMMTSAAIQVGASQPGVIVMALIFDLVILGIFLMPWNFILTKVSVTPQGITISKWPGIFTYTLDSSDIDQVVYQSGKVLSTTELGRSTTTGTPIVISRCPLTIDAWTAKDAVLVTSRCGAKAMLLPTHRHPERLMGILQSIQPRTQRPA
jgi:hypothetical protein